MGDWMNREVQEVNVRQLLNTLINEKDVVDVNVLQKDSAQLMATR